MSSLYFRFAVRGDRAMASPLLDRLLARADDFYTVTDWRADAVRLDEPFAAAPLALSAAHGTVSGAWVCFATPVHYVAEMSNVRLARNGILRLKEATAAALAEDFNRIWHDSGIRMKVGRFADLFCISMRRFRSLLTTQMPSSSNISRNSCPREPTPLACGGS